MGLPFLMPPPVAGCGDPGASVANACMTDTAQYLTRTPAAAGNLKVWTLSLWVKRAVLARRQGLFGVLGFGTYWGYLTSSVQITDTDQIMIQARTGSNGESVATAVSTAVFRDPAAFLHIVVAVDMTAATGAAAMRLWVNGVAQAMTVGGYTQGVDTYIGSTHAHYLGRALGSSGLTNSTYDFSGAIAEAVLLDGIVAGPDAWGYTNRFGVWVPRRFAGRGLGAVAYGAQGFHLDFADALALGADVSGNGNAWTVSGLTASSQVTDTPTHGYPILNSAWPGASAGIKLGGLQIQSDTSGSRTTVVAAVPRGGKVYHEVTGVANSGYGQALLGLWSPAALGSIFVRWIGTGETYPTYGTYGLAVDLDAGKVWVRLPTGLYAGGGDPVAGTSPTGTFTPVTGVMPMAGASVTTNTSYQGIGNYNFGQRAYVLGAPDGFANWSVPDAPCPAIKRPDRYFATRLASGGAGGADLPWSPLDRKTLVLSKRRDSASDWRVNDTLRPGRAWATNTAAADFAEADGLTFAAQGYAIGGNAAYAGSRVDYVWRASAAAGFDILLVDHVNGVADVVPHAVGGIIDHAWVVPVGAGGTRRGYWRAFGGNQYIALNGMGALVTDAGWFASSAVDLTLAASLPTGRYAVYAWRSVPQFSCFGTYTGNGSVDGAFIPVGFLPALSITKRSNGTTNHWQTHDVAANASNPLIARLFLSDVTAETTNSDEYLDHLATGIKARSGGGNSNAASTTYGYAAWAAAPGKFARAR